MGCAGSKASSGEEPGEVPPPAREVQAPVAQPAATSDVDLEEEKGQVAPLATVPAGDEEAETDEQGTGAKHTANGTEERTKSPSSVAPEAPPLAAEGRAASDSAGGVECPAVTGNGSHAGDEGASTPQHTQSSSLAPTHASESGEASQSTGHPPAGASGSDSASSAQDTEAVVVGYLKFGRGRSDGSPPKTFRSVYVAVQPGQLCIYASRKSYEAGAAHVPLLKGGRIRLPQYTIVAVKASDGEDAASLLLSPSEGVQTASGWSPPRDWHFQSPLEEIRNDWIEIFAENGAQPDEASESIIATAAAAAAAEAQEASSELLSEPLETGTAQGSAVADEQTPSMPVVPRLQHAGYLNKQPDKADIFFRKIIKRRWLVLDGSFLRYWDSEESWRAKPDTSLRGYDIDLSSYRVVTSSSEGLSDPGTLSPETGAELEHLEGGVHLVPTAAAQARDKPLKHVWVFQGTDRAEQDEWARRFIQHGASRA